MAGVVLQFCGAFSAHRILRDDLLASLYGKAAGNPRALIDFALADFRLIAEHMGLEALDGRSQTGLTCGRVRRTQPHSVADALRQAALMFSSAANIDALDETDDSDTPNQEEQVKRWTTEIRERVALARPELGRCFNQVARFYADGEPVRFGFLSERTVMHFGVLRPTQQPASVRDARARLWELAKAREAAGYAYAALVLATPRDDDPTLGEKQRTAARRNEREIEREADEAQILLKPVNGSEHGAKVVLELA